MKIRRIFTLFLFVFFVLINFSFSTIAAENKKTYWDDDGKYNYTTDIVEEREVANDTTYIHDSGYSTRSGLVIDQDLFMLFQKTDASKGTKVVTWGGYNKNHTVSTALPRMSLADIARDYEANHPGWKVIGGINADQYCWGYGTNSGGGYDILENRPYYTMKADNENWFSHHFMGSPCANLVGFLNDGSPEQIVYNPNEAVKSYFKINVYDENNNLLGKFDVDDLNPKTKKNSDFTYIYAVTDTGNTSAPITRNKETKSINISSNNNLYIVGNADKTWVGNSVDYSWYKTGVNSFFGKGTIDNVSKSVTLSATQFAIETTNSELLSLLNIGCYVVAQHEIYGGYEKCESAIGWHSILIKDGVEDNSKNNDYNNSSYPRSAVGITEDGRVVLITGEGTGKRGTNQKGFYAQELNAICNAYGIKTAFNLDGGGSVTMILRNKNGDFNTVNQPSDGSDRSIYSGLFFVVKDVEAEISTSKITTNSIELDINVLNYGVYSDVEKTYVEFKGKTSNGKDFEKLVEVKDGKAIIDGLEANIEYTYNIQYKPKDYDKLIKSIEYYNIKTAKEKPILNSISIDFKDSNLEIYISIKDPHKAIEGYIQISLDGGENFYRVSDKRLLIEDFKGDPISDIVIKYYINLNDGKDSALVEEQNINCNYSISAFMKSLLYKNNDAINNCIK